MSAREEEQFAALVRLQGPAQRDPIFRLKVLERREIEQFRRRSWLFVALAVLAVAGAALVFVLRPQAVDGAAVILFGIGLSAAGFYLAPAAIRHLRSLQR